MNLSSILLVDDDQDDFDLTRALVEEFDTERITVDWEPSYQRGLSTLLEHRHDAALIDYRLGTHNGCDLLTVARANGCATPLIMLTGENDRDVDAQALCAGADDYLIKGEVTATLLERSLRYAMERRRGLAAIADREERLCALLENSEEVIMLLDGDGTIMFASDAIARVSGYQPAQVMGRNGLQNVHPDDVERIKAEFARCRALPGTRFSTDFRALHANGSWQQREVTAVNRLDNPAVRAVVLNYRDVTERTRTAVALVKSEAHFRSTFESAPIGMAHTELDGRCVRVNERLRTLLGYSEKEFLSIDLPSITHPDDLERSTEGRAQLLAGTVARYEAEKRYRRSDGSYIWVKLTVSLDRNDRGEPKHFIATVEDISARKHAQQELAHIFELSPDMICTSNYDGYFTRTNPAFTLALGHTAEQLQGSQFLTFVHDDDRAATIKELGRLAEGETTFGFTNRYRTASGDYRWIEWHAKADTEAQVIYAIARDQTDKRLLEEQFRQAQKMEAVGRLAGGVAHDFNNLLTVILGFAEMSIESLAADDPRRHDIKQIQHAGNSATALTRQLLAFSRRQILAPQILDLNVLVKRMQPMLRRLIGEDIALEVLVDPALVRINADPGQIEQVLMNLAVNAKDAMPMGGVLRIDTAMVELDAAFVATHAGATRGHHVRLSVTDNGAGMAPAVLAHLFEPFFTTKEQGKGTGLGLATVYGIVKQSGGYVGVQSAVGLGTTFSAHFPSVNADATIAPEEAVSSVTTGSETVLIVEDQLEVRQMIKSVLVRQGYTVIEAADGRAALELLGARREPVDLLLTDVVMPLMSGRELVIQLDGRGHSIPVIYMSGYTADEITKHGVLDPETDFLPKPFQARQLLVAVRGVLDRRSAPTPA